MVQTSQGLDCNCGIRLWSTTIFVVYLVISLTGAVRAELKEYCFPANFNASCPAGHVIIVEEARYGRLRRGGCLKTDYQIGCWADVLPLLDLRCSGRRRCIVPIPDTALHAIQPCPKDLFAYLESSYRCQPVEVLKSTTMCEEKGRGGVATVTWSKRGFLSSLVTGERGVGGVTCPWLIRMQPGQRVNLTLMDFGVASRFERGASDCQIYAVIRDMTSHGEMTLCGGFRRERPVYVSEGSEVQVSLHTYGDDVNTVHYVILYEALGCGNPHLPAGAWYKRKGDQATVGCNFTTQVWHIVCSTGRWIGTVDNCTADIASAGIHAHTATDENDDILFPVGLVVAIVVGVGVGLLSGTLLLALIYVSYKRYRESHRCEEFVDDSKATSQNFCQVPMLPSGGACDNSQQVAFMPHPSHAASISGCYWFTEDGAICRTLPHTHQRATTLAGYCNVPPVALKFAGDASDLALVQPLSCSSDMQTDVDNVTHPCRCYDDVSVTSPVHTRTMPTTLV